MKMNDSRIFLHHHLIKPDGGKLNVTDGETEYLRLQKIEIIKKCTSNYRYRRPLPPKKYEQLKHYKAMTFPTTHTFYD